MIRQKLKDTFSLPSKITGKTETERRASMFGMVQSGKTTILGLLHIICAMYANRENEPGKSPQFHSMVEERSSNIRVIAAELRKGMFPEKTPENHVFEADYLWRFNKPFGEDYIRLPCCETAGETFTKMLKRFGEGQYDIDPNMRDAHLIVDYILHTDAIILFAPVTRGVGIEAEIGAPVQLPDVNLSRLLEGIFKYKMKDKATNPGYRPIRGIAVFLTKYDILRDHLEANHMNLNTEMGVHAFMSKHFPDTYQVLGWYGLENVKFWPTGLELVTRRNEITKKREAVPHPLNPSRGWQIEVDHNRNMPKADFYEKPMFEFIDWVKNTVMA